MTTLVLWEVTIKPEYRERSDQFMLDQLPATRAFKGCRKIEAFRDQKDPNHIMLVEYWDSFADYERYVAWRQETGVLPDYLIMCATPPILKSYDLFG